MERLANAEEKDYHNFINKLWMPPVDDPDAIIPPESPWSAQSEAASLHAFAAQFGTGGTGTAGTGTARPGDRLPSSGQGASRSLPPAGQGPGHRPSLPVKPRADGQRR